MPQVWDDQKDPSRAFTAELAVMRAWCILFLSVVLAFLCVTAPAKAQQKIAITFDDLPAAGQASATLSRLQVAQSILETLHREKMPPVFGFINGVRTEEAPDTELVLKAWRDAGQPLGSHTWSHPDLESTSPAAFEADILRNEPLLQKYMPNQDWHWFRYPYLHEGDTIEKHRALRSWLAAHHYTVAEVTMDFEDYLWNEPYVRCQARSDIAAIQQLHNSYLATAESYAGTYRTMARQLYGHDIPYVLLLHANTFNAHMLPELLALYRRQGFTFISLPEAQRDPAYAVNPDSGYPGGGALTEQLVAKRKLPFPPNTKPYQALEATCR